MEESVNFVRGYGKVNPTDEETAPAPSRRKTTAVVVSLALLITIVAAATISVAVVRHSHSKPPESQTSSAKTVDSIKAVCAVTQHPDSCFADVSSMDSGDVSDPEIIFNRTLRLAVDELANISSLPKTLISKSNDLRTGSALRDCASLFDDALSQLRNSVEAMHVVAGSGGGKVLTEAKIGDLTTWISAAMTDQETCVDGLEEMGSTAVDVVKARMQRSSRCMSNSLAILHNIQTLLDKFGLGLH